jgi:formylglycine-generating enzyme required for sulfatase activity
MNKKGCYYANFKPNRGNYSADGGLYTTKVNSYIPNDYGLYNMSGNVAEWTISPYQTNAYGAYNDLSPDIKYKSNDADPQYYKRRSLRGGSWKDVAYYLQVSTRDWEFEDSAKAYIGFRCIYPQIASALTNKMPTLPKTK